MLQGQGVWSMLSIPLNVADGTMESSFEKVGLSQVLNKQCFLLFFPLTLGGAMNIDTCFIFSNLTHIH